MANTPQPQKPSYDDNMKQDNMSPSNRKSPQTPTLGSVDTIAKKLQDTLPSDMTEQAKEYVSDLSDQVSEVYESASMWVRENRNVIFMGLGAVAAIGLVGWYTMRNRSHTEFSHRK